MKVETTNFVYLTPPDSKGPLLVIIQKPIGGGVMVVMNIVSTEDVQALQTVTKPQ